MARKQPVSTIKSFSNLRPVLEKMLELRFFVNEGHLEEAYADLAEEYPSPHKSNEFWYSNGVIEVKIFRGMFGAYELCNYRGQHHKDMEALFEVASLSRNS